MVGCLSCVVPLSVSVSAFFTGLVVLLFRVVGGLCVFYVCRLLFFSVCGSYVCVVGGCVLGMCLRVLFFLFSFFFCVVVCKPRVLCVVLGLWRFVF